MCDAGRGVGHHRAGRLPLALPSAHQRARTPHRERRARRADGLHAARRPVLADRRRRARVTARGARNARTRAAARCSSTRSTAPTSSRGCSGRRRSVYARTRNVFGYDVEDTAVCTIEHDSGVVGTLISIFNGVRGREERRLEVFFEQGAVEVTTDFLVGAPRRRLPRPTARRTTANASTWPRCATRTSTPTGITRRDFFVYLYPAARAFVRAVRRQPARVARLRRRACAPMRSSTRPTDPPRPVSRWS